MNELYHRTESVVLDLIPISKMMLINTFFMFQKKGLSRDKLNSLSENDNDILEEDGLQLLQWYLQSWNGRSKFTSKT